MPSQSWNPERYARQARFVSDLGEPLLELLAPRAGERVLDLGCGDGALTEKLVAAGCAVVGVDASTAQVAAARARGIDARVGDATRLGFEREFDAVLSNAVLHWVREPDAAIASVRRALGPGGRFVAEFGGAGNVAAVVGALTLELAARGLDAAELDPWYFPTAEEYAGRLAAQGFEVTFLDLFERPTPIPGDVSDWLEIFAQPFLAPLPEAERPAFTAAVRERLRPRLFDAERGWSVDYVRLRVAARLPPAGST